MASFIWNSLDLAFDLQQEIQMNIYLFQKKHNKYISSLYLLYMPFIKAKCFSKT
jgi:hypothetical protein